MLMNRASMSWEWIVSLITVGLRTIPYVCTISPVSLP